PPAQPVEDPGGLGRRRHPLRAAQSRPGRPQEGRADHRQECHQTGLALHLQRADRGRRRHGRGDQEAGPQAQAPAGGSFDWTEFRDFHTLMAAACIKGRSVPLLWASYKEWKFLRSQNSLEEGLLRRLRTLIPETIRVVILADRGFGRAEWAAVCQELSFDYVVRIKPNVTVACT